MTIPGFEKNKKQKARQVILNEKMELLPSPYQVTSLVTEHEKTAGQDEDRAIEHR